MEFSFRIHANRVDGSVNRRFHKVRYTAALRLGEVLPAERGFVELSFEGQPSVEVDVHGENKAYDGRLILNGRIFEDVVAIVRPRDARKFDLVTFWPRSQHPDAHQSYTDPLVDTAVDGTPFDIKVVASRMYEAFKANAGASPATLMKVLYDEETGLLRESAHRLADLLDESLHRERETTFALDTAHAKLAEATAEAERAKSERTELEEIVAALRAQAANAPMATSQDPNSAWQTTLNRPSRTVTRQWQSQTKNSQHMNVGIDAYVDDVSRQGNKIYLRFIDSKGSLREIHDFGVKNGFVSSVFDYLSTRKGRRAVFLVTWKPGDKSMLASDTMMLEKYSQLWT